MAEKQLETKQRRNIAACCDVYEEGGKITLKMEMPGVTKDNLNINVSGDELVIEGKRDSLEIPNGEYLMREIRDADFYRSYTVDENIDRDKIEAQLSDGILTLTLGMKESQKPKQIKVVNK